MQKLLGRHLDLDIAIGDAAVVALEHQRAGGGFLIKASHGEVSGNHIEGCRMSGILVTPEYWWLEAGSSSDLQIAGNTLTNCGGIAICVQALAGNGAVASAGAHQNIAIVGNTVKRCA